MQHIIGLPVPFWQAQQRACLSFWAAPLVFAAQGELRGLIDMQVDCSIKAWAAQPTKSSARGTKEKHAANQR